MLDADKHPYEAWAALNLIASVDQNGPGVVYGVKRAGCSDNKCKTVLAYLFDLRRRGILRKCGLNMKRNHQR